MLRGNDMLDMLDWLLGRQAWIEKSLARRHLEGATLLLYDVSSSYLEGRCSPLAAFGHNRDGKQGKQQIVFGLESIALVGDRGMLTTARLRDDLNPRLRHERARKREDLLSATERILETIAPAPSAARPGGDQPAGGARRQPQKSG